ncbi:MAG: amino acid adenylation domain-containing protein, partial [bacterium]|nr:amino acid adenylation domain-containing protein [bacterium]
FSQPFELHKPPLLRVMLVKTGDKRHILALDMHHIISDGTSQGILIRDFMALYEDKEPEPHKFQYKDFAGWQNSEETKNKTNERENHWISRFSGEIPVIRLPIDYPRPLMQRFEGETIPFALEQKESLILTELALKEGASVFMVVLAIFNILLSKVSRDEDIIIGTGTEGRGLNQWEGIIGMFINTLALRNHPRTNLTFREFLGDLKTNTLEDFENQDYPFEDIIDRVSINRDTGRNPLFDVMIQFNNQDLPRLKIPRLHLKPYPYNKGISRFDLTLWAWEREQGLTFAFEYSTHLFNRGTIDILIRYFKEIAASVIHDADRELSEIKGISQENKQDILLQINQTIEAEDQRIKKEGQVLQHRLDNSLKKYRNNVAVEYGTTSLTYGELDKRSVQIARRIITRGTRPGTFVGVSIDNRINFILAIIGILKAGAVFVPLDPALPTHRLDVMIESIGLDVIINKEWLTGVETGKETLKTPLNIQYQPEDPIYIYFTSGSTGTPKAILGKNTSVLHFIQWEIDTVGINETFNTSQLITPGFDAFLRDVFVPLFSGGRLCIPFDTGIKLDSTALTHWLERSRINLVHCVPSLFRLLEPTESNPESFKHLKYVLLSGEKINASDLTDWFDSFNDRITFLNLYGPTETTMTKTCHVIQPDDLKRPRIPIGFPMRGVGVLVLDKDMNPCEPLVTGDIFICTPYATHGYLNDPTLNNERFILAHSYSYNTGDTGKLLSDGSIDLLGRNDRQIKLRGIRIELGEVESALFTHPQVKEAAVIKKELSNGNEILSAFITIASMENNETPAPEFIDTITNHLSGILPDYMVPGSITAIESIPRKPNGKVDYEALNTLETGPQKDYVAPTDEIERRLAVLWMEVLNIENPGVTGHFFQLGGHSLNVMTLITKIHREFDIRIPLGEIFTHPTIQMQASIIRDAETEKYHSIEAVEDKDYYPASAAQKRLYVLHQMEPESTAYNITQMVELEGVVDRNRLEDTFRQLINRHESLRTSFHLENEEPVQRIRSGFRCAVEYNPAGSIVKHFIRPFDLTGVPLLRVGLQKIENQNHLLMVDIHHIVSDGVSHNILIRDFMALYDGAPLKPLKLRYRDFSQWQHSHPQQEAINRQHRYWLETFAGEIPVLNIPTDHVRPEVQRFKGDTIAFPIREKETAKLRELAVKEGTTLYTLLLAVFNVLLAELSGQEDIVIGSPAAGRGHADLENMIGMFVNTLALRHQPESQVTFIDFLHRVRDNTLKAFENQDYPFEDLVDQLSVERDVSRNPLFDVMLVLQNMELTRIRIPGLTMKPYKYDKHISKFDLTLYVVDTNDKLLFSLEYCSKLFDRETIRRFISFFKEIISSVLDNSGQRISEIESIPQEERERILYEFNNTALDYRGDKTIHRLFEEQVERTPFMVALSGGNPKSEIRNSKQIQNPNDPNSKLLLTYRELDNRAGQLAYSLQEKGVQPGVIVGIMVGRNIGMMIGLLGILKAGGAYLPLDPHYPDARIRYVLAHSGAKFLVVDEGVMAQKSLDIKKEIITIPVNPPEYLSSRPSQPLNFPTSFFPGPAYVIYTSGSTGHPKGVVIPHRNAVNFIKGMTQVIDFSPGKSILALTTISFDIFFLETLLPVTLGLKVVIAGEESQRDAVILKETILSNRIDILQVTPSRLQMLLSLDSAGGSGSLSMVEQLIVGGEAFPVHLFEEARQVFTGNIYNVYGPTESTIWSTVKNLTHSTADQLTIGSPIANTTVLIVNKAMRMVPVGLPGELLIGGDGVASGYLNAPELTIERFVLDKSFTGVQGAVFQKSPLAAGGTPWQGNPMIYKTGDLARWLPDGEIEFLGRIDHQVKVRGFRIELGEIETQLLIHPDIRETIVVARKDQNGNNYLCAYYVPLDGHIIPVQGDVVSDSEFTSSQLRSYLSVELPEYMLPSYFIPVDRIPLTPNGKVDRKSLPEPGDVELKSGSLYVAPGTPVEQVLTETWEQVLGIASVSIEDNFFEVGGDSIKSIQIVSRMKRAGYHISMSDIFRNPRISGLASMAKEVTIERKELKRGDFSRAGLPVEMIEQLQARHPGLVEDIYPLTPMQEGMLFHTLYENEERADYFEQMSYRLEGELNPPLLEQSVNELVKRHDVLRTVFFYEDLDRPVQMVLKERASVLYFEDLTGFLSTHQERLQWIREFKAKDRRRLFDLGKDSLMRVAVIKAGDDDYYITWSFHHILMDGWSIGIVLSEFFDIYTNLIENRDLQLPPVEPYRTDIQWLEDRESEYARRYWETYLKSYDEGATIPRKKISAALEGGYKPGAVFTRLDEVQTSSLKKIAARNQVTLNTLVQAAWAIVLGRYSAKTDVLFGILVSGRPAQIEGIESMVGCFINTIPVRIQFHREKTFTGLLRNIQDRAIESEPHHYYPLADIQAQSPLKQNLLDHMMQFQNFPIAEQIERIGEGVRKKKRTGTMKLSNVDVFEQGNYDFNVIIFPGDQL